MLLLCVAVVYAHTFGTATSTISSIDRVGSINSAVSSSSWSFKDTFLLFSTNFGFSGPSIRSAITSLCDPFIAGPRLFTSLLNVCLLIWTVCYSISFPMLFHQTVFPFYLPTSILCSSRRGPLHFSLSYYSLLKGLSPFLLLTFREILSLLTYPSCLFFSHTKGFPCLFKLHILISISTFIFLANEALMLQLILLLRLSL